MNILELQNLSIDELTLINGGFGNDYSMRPSMNSVRIWGEFAHGFFAGLMGY